MHIILSDKRENQTAIAQQANKIQVKGNVTDMAGEPVIGASILEKGTTNGIVTDFNGDFSLNVNPRCRAGGFVYRLLCTRSKSHPREGVENKDKRRCGVVG